MHVFQPCPIDLVEMNPFNKFSKEWALVTAGSKKSANTMTISWGGTGTLWGKNVVFIFIRDSRYTKKFIDESDFFSLSFFDEEYRDAMNYCGSHSGREENKIEKAGLTLSSLHGIPYIDEATEVYICNKLAASKIELESLISPDLKEKWYKEKNLHTMYIAEVIEVLAR